MSANTDAPQQEEVRSFEDAADALFAQDAAPAPQDTPAAQQPSPEATEPEAPTPAASATVDDDADDESLDVAERIARAERRATKQSQAEIAAAKAEAEAEKRRVLSFQGNLEQEKRRRQQIEAERDEARRLANDADARDDARWNELINSTTDPATKAQYQQMFADDKARRDLAREKREWELQKQQQQEEANFTREQQRQAAEAVVRQSAVGEIVTAVDRYIADIGLPASEIADVKAWLNSPEVQLNAQHLPIVATRQGEYTVNDFRDNLLQRADQVIQQRLTAYQERQAAQNRAEAKETYRPEKPVGQGGAAPPDDLSRFHGTNDTLGMLESMYPQ